MQVIRFIPRLLAPALFIFVFTAPLSAESEGRRIFTTNEARVLVLRTHFEQETTGNGSAFIVSYKDRNFLITNYHVISAGHIFLEIEGEKVANLQVLRVNDTGDIAILTFPKIDDHQAVPLQAYEPLRGEKVYALGFPGVPGNKDVSLTITDGLVSNNNLVIPEEGPQRRRFIQVSAALNPGNSGGPIFSGEGRLIGMATGGIMNRQSMNLAIPTEDIMREIDLIDRRPERKDAEQELRARFDLISESVKAKDFLRFGYYYSPEYKLKLFDDVRRINERVYSAYRLTASRGPQSPEQAMAVTQQYLEPDEFMYYLMLMHYYQGHPSDNFGDVIFEVSLNPFLASQLYLSGRFLYLMHHLADLDDRKFEYRGHTIEKITFDESYKNADVEITVNLEHKSFPAKLKFVREWGNWFLVPAYDYQAILKEDAESVQENAE